MNVLELYSAKDMRDNKPVELFLAQNKMVKVRILPIALAEDWCGRAQETMALARDANRKQQALAAADRYAEQCLAAVAPPVNPKEPIDAAADGSRRQKAQALADEAAARADEAYHAAQESSEAYHRVVYDRVQEYLEAAGVEDLVVREVATAATSK